MAAVPPFFACRGEGLSRDAGHKTGEVSWLARRAQYGAANVPAAREGAKTAVVNFIIQPPQTILYDDSGKCCHCQE
jgi:hypothetical protein